MSKENRNWDAKEIASELNDVAIDGWNASEMLLGLAKITDPRFDIDTALDGSLMDADEILQRGVSRLFLLFRERFDQNAGRVSDLACDVRKLAEREGGDQ